MATKYEQGRRFEQRVRNYLEEAGYCVVRSAGSKGPADLVAFDQSVIMLIQCATSEEAKSERDREKLRDFAVNRHMAPVMVWKDGYRGPLVFDWTVALWRIEDEVC
ncbi:MAG: hypothetical protein GWN93_06130 [Deltaproteobacteria bacterium]|nr:hypothetical protein [Deltaproteobacteria bacterium]